MTPPLVSARNGKKNKRGTDRFKTYMEQGNRGIDLFTDTAAILNYFDLRSIIGCSGGMSTFCLFVRAPLGTFFLKIFLE